MSQFRPAFDFMLPHEGGYVFDPADLGGETKYGISKRSYPGEDIKNLTVQRAAFLYERDFWNPYPLAQIASQAIANKVFDMAVNMGPRRAFRILQQACDDCGEMVACDGSLGPITLAAVNACSANLLLVAIRNRAAKFYISLAADDASQAKFLNGWLARARA